MLETKVMKAKLSFLLSLCAPLGHRLYQLLPLDVSAVGGVPRVPISCVQGLLGPGGVSPAQPLLVQRLHVRTGLGGPHRDVGVDAFHLPQQGLVRAPILRLGLAPAAQTP